MKTQTKSDRKNNSIRPGRWTAYMAAAAASTFAGAGSAEAEIHYSGHVGAKLTGNHHVSLALSNGASLVFQNSYLSLFYQKFYFLTRGVNSGSARGYGSTNTFRFRRFLSNLRPRENVSAGDFLSVSRNPGHGVLILGTDGRFANGIQGFVGFRFNTGNGTQYGWARIQAKASRPPVNIIQDYAWGDVGDTILTGQTSSDEQPADQVVEQNSLGWLALGAAGLAALRKSRSRTAR